METAGNTVSEIVPFAVVFHTMCRMELTQRLLERFMVVADEGNIGRNFADKAASGSGICVLPHKG